MAVGMMVKCEKCGESYDEGNGYHPAYCDNGKAREAEKKELGEFNNLPIDKRLEVLYMRMSKLEKTV